MYLLDLCTQIRQLGLIKEISGFYENTKNIMTATLFSLQPCFYKYGSNTVVLLIHRSLLDRISLYPYQSLLNYDKLAQEVI